MSTPCAAIDPRPDNGPTHRFHLMEWPHVLTEYDWLVSYLYQFVSINAFFPPSHS